MGTAEAPNVANQIIISTLALELLSEFSSLESRNISRATLVFSWASVRASTSVVVTVDVLPTAYDHSKSRVMDSVLLILRGKTSESTLMLGKAWTGAVSSP